MRNMDFSFVNFTTYNFQEDFFKKIFERVLKEKKVKEDFGLEVVLLGQRKMRDVNKRYSGVNKATDVLSFPAREVLKSTKKDIQFINPKDSKNSLGEILLCPSKIKKNAKKFKKEFEQEMTFVFIHGILHLLGYDHRSKSESKKMRSKEKELLKKIYK